jgi:hypothetical protein
VVTPGVVEGVASLEGDSGGEDLVWEEGEAAVEAGGDLALDLYGEFHMGHILTRCRHMGDTIR